MGKKCTWRQAIIRLNITVEGDTEEFFVNKTLAPHLGDFGVIAVARRVATSKDKKRNIVYRGGFRQHHAYSAVKKDVISWLKEDKDSKCRFTTMFDLYALPKSFPGSKEAEKVQDKYQRVNVLEKAFKDNLAQHDIDVRRFIPYIQLHEFEALILSDPNSLSCQFDGCEDAIQNLIGIVAEKSGNPELVNDKYETCPSRRIIAQIPRYSDDKPFYGATVADKIGIQTMRGRCRHFNDWLTQLEKLGR